MTLLQDSPAGKSASVATGAATGSAVAIRRHLPPVSPADVAVAVATTYWALPLTHAIGGRDAGKEGVLAALLLVCIALVKPWRQLPMLAVAVPVWLAVAALIVPAVAPTGWRGADDATGYACAALAFVVAAGWADTPARRATLAGGIGLAGLDQICHALLPWWGGGNPAAELSGTFYWHNPFAAYLLPPAVMGAALVTWRQRPWQLVGWVATPLAISGIVLSSSRATLAVTALAVFGVGAYAARTSGRRKLLPRFVEVAVLAVAVTELLPGPPLFDHRVSPLAATTARSTGGESLAANGGYRVEFWRSALENFVHHPFIGTGYHGLVEASLAYTPAGWARTNYAHNGYLQALSDGGLLLGLPLIIGCILLVALASRTLLSAVKTGTTEPLAVAAAFGLLAALAHSAVDFDWSHSSLFVMDAVLAGLLVAATTSRRRPVATTGSVPWLSVALVVPALLAVAMGWLGHRDRADGQTHAVVNESAAAFDTQQDRSLASDVAARSLLGLALQNPGSVSDPTLRAAIAGTRRESSIDLALAAERARAGLRLGDRATALSVVRRLEQVVNGRDAYAVDLAPLLADLGQRQQAFALLRPRLAAALLAPGSGTVPLAAAWAQISPAGDPAAVCLVQTAEGAGGHPMPDCPALISAALAP